MLYRSQHAARCVVIRLVQREHGDCTPEEGNAISSSSTKL